MGPKRKSKTSNSAFDVSSDSLVNGKLVPAAEICLCTRCGFYFSGFDLTVHVADSCRISKARDGPSWAMVDKTKNLTVVCGRLRERKQPEGTTFSVYLCSSFSTRLVRYLFPGFPATKDLLVFLNPRTLKLLEYHVGKEAVIFTATGVTDSYIARVLPERSLPPFDVGVTVESV